MGGTKSKALRDLALPQYITEWAHPRLFILGIVDYNLTAWLEKNKDPLNDSVVELFKNASNKYGWVYFLDRTSTVLIICEYFCRLIVEVFKDHPGLTGEVESGGKKRKGGGKTVSSFYKEQLSNLMTTLHATEPHFIR